MTIFRFAVLGACLAAWWCAPVQAATYEAFQITEANVDALPRTGPDAIAGIGDWWLTDGSLCFAVSDVAHDAGIVAGGGSLIDAGHCALGNDQWAYSNVLTGLSKEEAIVPERISASAHEQGAEIVVVGEAEGIRQTLRFVLSDAHPGELRQQLVIERTAKGRSIHLSGLLTLYPHRAMTPFTQSSIAPDYSLGFDHPLIDRENMRSLVAGMMPADWITLVGEYRYDSQVSYGLQLQRAELVDRDGQRHRLPQFLVTLPDYALYGWLTRPLWIDSEKLGLLQMLQSQFMDLAVGERMEVTFRLLLGQQSDVASITDQVNSGPLLYGFVEADGASIAVNALDGRPLTQRRLADSGSFSLRLPASVSQVEVAVTAPWGETLQRRFELNGNTDTGLWRFSERARLQLPRGEVMSLHFLGLEGTPTPDLYNDRLGFQVAGEPVDNSLNANTLALARLESDPRWLSLPPGDYRVLASRGPEYSVTEARVKLLPGSRQRLQIEAPTRLLNPTGWVSADLHVHSGASFDSSLPIRERLSSFVAQGTQVLAATEHNRVVDYRQQALELGLGDRLQLLSGVELTGMSRTDQAPKTIGHSNVYPYPVDPRAFAGGLPKVEGRPLRSLIGSVRERSPNSLFQLNHPRATDPMDDDLAFLDHLSVGSGYDPEQPLDSRQNRSLLVADPVTGLRDIDFDVLEVLNGSEFIGYQRSLRDWFSFLKQGHRKTATGNSDSHSLGRVVGLPRNYIAWQGAFPVPEESLIESLRAGRSYASTGPLLNVTVINGEQRAGLGDEIQGGELLLAVGIRASDWVNVDTLRVYVNGDLYQQLAVQANNHYSVPVKVTSDSFVVVEVLGEAGDIYRALYPGMRPLAFSNPVYIDADANGQWQAPGM